MHEHLDFKVIAADAIPKAIEIAHLYRDLNDPMQAESICLDVLAVAPAHQEATKILVLSLTDQFADPGGTARVRDAFRYLKGLEDAYQRAYFRGLIEERQARALLGHRVPDSLAYDGFVTAMERYDEAAAIRPAGDDNALLRWNSCLRTIRRHRLEPLDDHPEESPSSSPRVRGGAE